MFVFVELFAGSLRRRVEFLFPFPRIASMRALRVDGNVVTVIVDAFVGLFHLVSSKWVLDCTSLHGTFVLRGSTQTSQKDEIGVFHTPECVVFAQFFSDSGHHVGVEKFSENPKETVVLDDPVHKDFTTDHLTDGVGKVCRCQGQVDQNTFEYKGGRDGDQKACRKEFDDGIEAQIALVEDPMNKVDDQEGLDKGCNEDYRVWPRKEGAWVKGQRQSNHEAANNKVRHNVPRQSTKGVQVRHDARLFATLAEPPTPQIVNILLIFVKRLVGDVIYPLVACWYQQTHFPGFLCESADGKTLEPALAQKSTARSHDTIVGAGDTVGIVWFLLALNDSIVVNFDFIVDFVSFHGRIGGVTTAEGVTAGSFVLIFPGILKGHSFNSRTSRCVEQVIFLRSSPNQVVSCSHAPSSSQDTQDDEKSNDEGDSKIGRNISLG
mmetsp:Transcript_122733/g.183610  ORF Transcript_122733/g.183610 Transcript_122733/m.183610 type:complete len:435 (-) Transcript_122733:1061-2365(-)